ncbi:HalOD1 output domain-containing protein [Halorarius litoreus]|uniref:HalOD1 output domain-containing protein n=1 Tax=Halorarius litoreus TaxID=2962676 RepID=UPI0020CC6EBA|nr:HalOD1 output domain-containing protein [Halorarius litoreus]
MNEEPLTVIDEQPDEDGVASAGARTYDIGTYMRAGRTCEGIVRALGRALRTEPHDVPLLHAAVDCDAVERLFRPSRDGRLLDDLSLTFGYEGQSVTITADCRLTIRDAAESAQR